MPTEVPESFSVTQFGFQTNKGLEAFAPVQQLVVEDIWAKYPGVDPIHHRQHRLAVSACDGEGVALHTSRATSRDPPHCAECLSHAREGLGGRVAMQR